MTLTLTLTRLELLPPRLARAHAAHERADDAAEAKHLLGGALVRVGAEGGGGVATDTSGGGGVEGALGADGLSGDAERLHPQEGLGFGLGLG